MSSWPWKKNTSVGEWGCLKNLLYASTKYGTNFTTVPPCGAASMKFAYRKPWDPNLKMLEELLLCSSTKFGNVFTNCGATTKSWSSLYQVRAPQALNLVVPLEPSVRTPARSRHYSSVPALSVPSRGCALCPAIVRVALSSWVSLCFPHVSLRFLTSFCFLSLKIDWLEIRRYSPVFPKTFLSEKSAKSEVNRPKFFLKCCFLCFDVVRSYQCCSSVRKTGQSRKMAKL